MPHLPDTIAAITSDEFNQVLTRELIGLGLKSLPLQAGLSQGSVALDDDLSVIIMNREDLGEDLKIRAGLFYTSTIAGCNCADDPSPIDKLNEYCEVTLMLNKTTAECRITLEDQA